MLATARDQLSVRPADCALVSVELIDEALGMGQDEVAEQEAIKLCALLEKTGSPRFERSIFQLTRNHSRLTSKFVARIREAMESAQAQRFSRLIGLDH